MPNSQLLRLVPSIATRRPAPKRIPSIAAQLARQQFTYVTQTWASPTLSDTTRQAYNTLGSHYPVGPTGATSGRAVFVSLNTHRLRVGMDFLMEPPPFREMTLPIDTFTLSVVNTGTAFHINLSRPTDFDGLFLVACTRSLSAGVTRLRPEDYLAVTSASHLGTTALDVGTAYVNAIGRAADVGRRVGVCLTPLSPLGFPGVPVYRDVIVTSA